MDRLAVAGMSEKGFTLIEVMIAMVLMAIGALSLLGVIAIGVQRAGSSQDAVIAREKAREAIESVHAARDTGALSWPNIRNLSDGGLFLAGERPLTLAGDDGLVNTADDGEVETLRSPGYDGQLNTDDDIVTSLSHFTREIRITDLPGNTGGINPNLREIVVNIKFKMRGTWRTYSLRTYVSAFS
jgi:prepilin-type N-terminal cleavage/methylation domain-containing protein